MDETETPGDPEADDTLNVVGLKCPMPALMTRRHVERAKPGTILLVLADDPMAPIDIPHMCHEYGYELLSERRDGPVAKLLIRKPA